MLKLLIIRAFPLLLRPAAIIFEGIAGLESHILVLVLPIAMMVLTITSIPVHLDYFKSKVSKECNNSYAKPYMSALTWLMLLVLVLLPLILIKFNLVENLYLIGSICCVFLIEKLADETSRFLEFNKNYKKWLLIQVLRSVWLFFPVIVAQIGYDYNKSFLLFAIIALSYMIIAFAKTLSFVLCFKLEGLTLIYKNLFYIVGSILPASHRQGPRIIIAKLYPEYAHVFLAVAQLCQSVSLVFNVKFQIPYRKIIARRTMTFHKITKSVMLKFLIASGSISMTYAFIMAFNIDEKYPQGFLLVLILIPILMADAISFAILSVYLGYLQWIEDRVSVLITYFACIASVVIVTIFAFAIVPIQHIGIIAIPIGSIIIALMWVIIILAINFQQSVRL